MTIEQMDPPTNTQRLGAWCLIVLLGAGATALLIGAVIEAVTG